NEPWARALRPEAVVRVGGGVSSKLLQEWLDGADYTAVVHERGDVIDPSRRAAAVVHGDAPAICRALAAQARAEGPLAALFAEADRRARAALEAAFADAQWSEPLVARE